MTAPRDWLVRRLDAAPPSLAERIRAALPAGEAGPEALADAALGRLAAAAAAPADDRETAYRLLAADALLTWACEAAAESGPESLRSLTGRYAARIEEGGPSS